MTDSSNTANISESPLSQDEVMKTDPNGYIRMITSRCMKAVAYAIKDGADPDDIANDLHRVLSGKKEYLLIKRKQFESQEPDGILIPMNIFNLLKKVKNEWALGKDIKFWQEDEEKKTPVYAVLEDRYNQAIGEFVSKQRIKLPDVGVAEVPVERWAYFIQQAPISETTVGELIIHVF
jgi:hypothetical protein